jgi:hypothetical protein
MYPLVNDLNIEGGTLVLILVVLAILVLIVMLFHHWPWRG